MKKTELRDFQEFINDRFPIHKDIVSQLIESYESNNSDAQTESQNVSENEIKTKKCGIDTKSCMFQSLEGDCENEGFCIMQVAFWF